MKKKYNFTFILFMISILLLIGILVWGNYLIKNYWNKIIQEGFSYTSFDIESPSTSHTVNLPINTTYSCSNFCGPQAQCAKTREQCSSDIDCFGCTPSSDYKPSKVYGFNDAGKLTYNQNPQYSVLTTDIASNAAIINNKSQVPEPVLGLDTWTQSANYGMKLFQDKMSYLYNINSNASFLSHYPPKESITGVFLDNGPPAANSYHL